MNLNLIMEMSSFIKLPINAAKKIKTKLFSPWSSLWALDLVAHVTSFEIWEILLKRHDRWMYMIKESSQTVGCIWSRSQVKPYFHNKIDCKLVPVGWQDMHLASYYLNALTTSFIYFCDQRPVGSLQLLLFEFLLIIIIIAQVRWRAAAHFVYIRSKRVSGAFRKNNETRHCQTRHWQWRTVIRIFENLCFSLLFLIILI
jgi:hypothetical protein